MIKCTVHSGIAESDRLKLMSALMGFSDKFQMIWRENRLGSDLIPSFLMECLVETSQASEWPGTKLHFGGAATSCIFRSKNGLEIDFFNLPAEFEDISLFRANGSLIFGSVTRENDVWLILEEGELSHLLQLLPYEIFVLDDWPSDSPDGAHWV